MLRDNRFERMLCEVNFFEFYRNAVPFDSMFRHLFIREIVLVALYLMHYGRNVAV